LISVSTVISVYQLPLLLLFILCLTPNSIRDLGVIIDNRLTFKDHVTSIVTRAHVRAMRLWRCFLCKDMDVLMRAFITYVRPLLE